MKTLLLIIFLTSGICYGQNKDSICEQIIRNCEWRTMRYTEQIEALKDSIELTVVRANIKINNCNESLNQCSLQSMQFSELYKREKEYKKVWKTVALTAIGVTIVEAIINVIFGVR